MPSTATYFDFLRNYELNARTKGTVLSQPLRDTLKRNQFGGTAGGHIIKDKLFYFGGYQGTRQRSDPANQTAYDPTAATLKGDFSVVDAAKSAGGCLSSAKTTEGRERQPLSRQPDSGFQFRSGGIQAGLHLLPDFLGSVRHLPVRRPANNPDDQWIGRIDYNISSKNVFFGRYSTCTITCSSRFSTTTTP
jgi:hypothetical protein